MAFKYFFLLDNLSMQLKSIILEGLCLFFWHKLHCFGWLLLHTLYCYQTQTQAKVRTCLTTFFSLYITLAITHKTYCRFFTLLIVSTYIFTFLLDVVLKKTQKILFQVLSSSLFWCACYWVRPFYLVYSFEVSLSYHIFASKNFSYAKSFDNKYISVFLVL